MDAWQYALHLHPLILGSSGLVLLRRSVPWHQLAVCCVGVIMNADWLEKHTLTPKPCPGHNALGLSRRQQRFRPRQQQRYLHDEESITLHAGQSPGQLAAQGIPHCQKCAQP